MRYSISMKNFIGLFFIITVLSACNNGGTPNVLTTKGSVNIQQNTPFLQDSDITRVVAALTSDTSTGGLSYTGTSSNLKGVVLPLSFFQTTTYFGAYVCNESGNNCGVTDQYSDQNYSVSPLVVESSNGASLQAERIGVAHGTDIYDAATWEIALSLAASHNVKGASFKVAQGQNKLLYYGFDANDPQEDPLWNANRANSSVFGYGSGTGLAPQEEYFYSMVPQSWLSIDPLANSIYSTYIMDKDFPQNNNAYISDVVSWLDWRPITGENAWAFLVGPLQSMYVQYSGKIPVSEFYGHTIQNSIGALHSIGLLQSQIGAIYYAPSGTDANSGGIVNPYQVSIENNASTLSGLLILKHVLDGFNAQNPGTVPDDIINNLNSMIFGGTTTFNGVSNKTDGIMSFFKNYAFNKSTGLFYASGNANDPKSPLTPWVATSKSLSVVDVNTWTLSLLAPLVDDWGFLNDNGKTINSYQIWQNVKQMGGFYGPDNKLWGVGYSSADGNGYENESPAFNKNGIISGEWTAGAINLIYTLKALYNNDDYKEISLEADEESMKNGLTSLSTDQYANNKNAFPEMPNQYEHLIPEYPNNRMLAFLYASKRYYIPFGWFANPLPSTCSTSWALMINYHFNPFVLGGVALAPKSYFSH